MYRLKYAHRVGCHLDRCRRTPDGFGGIQAVSPTRRRRELSQGGVPESWLNRLAGLLLLAAAGLVVGLWWPIAGIAAAIGLVVYFVVAVGFHVRANDTAHVATPGVLASVAVAIVAMHFASY